MNRFYPTVATVLATTLLSLSPALAGTPSQEELDKFEPLAGSEWAKAYPGVLPYEECAFTVYPGKLGFGSTTTGMVIGISLEEERMQNPTQHQLVCWSRKLNLAFALSMNFVLIKHAGLDFTPMMTVIAGASVSVSRLDGHRVEDV